MHTEQAASLTGRNNRLAQLLLGYLVTSGAKSHVVFVLGDPPPADFLQGDEISRLSRLVFEI